MATGTDAKIAAVLFDHLRTLTTDPVLETSWPDVDYPRDDGTKPDNFMEVRFIPNRTRQVSFGTEPQQHVGIMQISVMWKSGRGVIAALDVAGQIVAHFKDQILFDDSGSIRVVISSVPYASPSLTDGDRTRWPVSIPYHAYEKDV